MRMATLSRAPSPGKTIHDMNREELRRHRVRVAGLWAEASGCMWTQKAYENVIACIDTLIGQKTRGRS